MRKFKAVIMDDCAMQRALKRISHEIIEKNGGVENLCIVGIRRRGLPLAMIIADNIRQIEGVGVPTGALDITFYRDDLKSKNSDPELSNTEIPFSVTDKTIVLVDDVIYTGRTVRAALEGIMKLGRPAKIQFAVLIDRGHRELPIRGDFVGKNVPTSQNEVIAVQIPPYDKEIAVKLYERVD